MGNIIKDGSGSYFPMLFILPLAGLAELASLYSIQALLPKLSEVYLVGEGSQKGTGIDMPKIRYADVLLNLAEALNEQGKIDEAVTVVNQVRARAGAQLLNSNVPTTVMGQADMRERIRNERYWELLGEDLIYFDELRWKTWKDKKFATYDDNGKQVVNGLRQVWGQATYHYAWGGDHYWLYPIPYNETQMNPNMEQNPGWK